MNEVEIYGGHAKIVDGNLIVTDSPLTRTVQVVAYNRLGVLTGVIALGFTIVGFFGQEGISIESILGFVLFLGVLLVIALGIALLIVLLVKRENPLRGGVVGSQSQTVPLENITKIGLVDGEQRLAVEFTDEGTTKTMIIRFRTEMEHERERLVTILEGYAKEAGYIADSTAL